MYNHAFDKKSGFFWVQIPLILVFFLVICVHHAMSKMTGISMVEIFKPRKGLAQLGYMLFNLTLQQPYISIQFLLADTLWG